MARWLVKTEPSTYSFGDLQRERTTAWEGVANALAQQHLRAMARGDAVLVYHTGSQRAVVGVAEVSKAPYPDPANPKLVMVDLKAGRALPRPVTLAEFKADRRFAGWDLLRLGRLSVMRVPEALWERILEMAETPAAG